MHSSSSSSSSSSASLPSATWWWHDELRRHAAPYAHSFEANVKGRWSNRTAVDVFATEFAYYPRSFYEQQVQRGALQVKRRGQWLTPDEVTVTLLQTADTVRHTVHRHELPIPNSGPIELLRFLPAAALGVFAARAADGLLCLSKPPGVPVHPCGRYFRNTITGLVAEGQLQRYRPPTAPPPGFEDFAAPEDLVSPHLGGDNAVSDGLLADIVKQLRMGGGAHTVHRLDKATTGLLLLATSRQVSATVFDIFSEKSEEEFETTSAPLAEAAEVVGTADAAAGPAAVVGTKRQRPSGGDAATVADAEGRLADPATRKVYLARVAGRFPDLGDGRPIVVSRGIYCASRKEGRFAALSEAEEQFRRASAKRRAEAARAAGLSQGTDERETAVALARQAVLNGGGDEAKAAKREAQRAATASHDDGADAESPLDAKWAETSFQLLRYDADADESVVECRPVTGRTHQLRVHLGLVLGHPIVLDTLYGWAPHVVDGASAATQSQHHQQVASDVSRLFGLPFRNATPADVPRQEVAEGCPECERLAMPEGLAETDAEFWSGFICLHASEYRLALRGVAKPFVLTAPPPPWL